MKPAYVTAAAAGLLSCPACALVSRPPAATTGIESPTARCPRCGAGVHARKPDSIARTWAFLLAAFVLYIPANVLPIMDTSSLFDAQQDTILSGVIYLWKSGSWGTALIVFIASVVTPLAKLLALTALLLSVHWKSAWRPHVRAQLYRAVSLVGRWSMLDIFVVTVLVALVQLQSVAVITAGPGAFAFGAVVVLTMLAAFSFDPRLIWDAAEATDD
ncbi:MAG: paraquat-inducible protein A [Betaproteobacteria bacterium]|nr:paraquat-inducible protein A [Betaproteobacteria bacterium]